MSDDDNPDTSEEPEEGEPTLEGQPIFNSEDPDASRDSKSDE